MNHRHFHLSLSVIGIIVASLLLPVFTLPADAASCDTPYYVRSGDTLNKIGEKFGITAYRIANQNNLKRPYTLWVGMKLCIPDKPVFENKQPKLSNKYANKAAADFIVQRDGEGVVVKVVNYSTKAVFLVKADDASDDDRSFVRLGTLNPANGKEFRFQLPKELQKGKPLWICMKDQMTDMRICRYLHATR